MNIALVILHADPARGGAERYTVDLAASLLQRGHAVSLLAQTFGEHLPPVTVAPIGRSKRGTRLGRYVQFCDELDRHLGETHYDIVHAMLPVRQCDVYHPHAGIAAEAAAADLRAASGLQRVAAQVASRLNRRRQAFAAVERALLTGSRPPITISLSQYVERTLQKHYHLPAGRTRILLNGVDLKRFDPAENSQSGLALRGTLGIVPDKIIALMIAQDFVRKGLDEAIKAIGAIKDSRLLLVAVGKQDPSPWALMAKTNHCEDRVIFPGPCPDPRPFYQMADFFVLPTRHDPCSLVVLEALAMGVPVISTATNGACEAMTSGTQGFVIAGDGDGANLAASIQKLLDDATRREMSAACLALRPSLSYQHHVDRLLEIYADAAAGGTAAP